MDDRKKSVLIVDDNDGVCRTLSFIFGKDYDTAVAQTGHDALQQIRDHFFNLVLLDIRLPDIQGTELLAQIKEMCPDIAAIVLTGHASLENAVQALNAGAFAYVMKPFNVPELLSSVRQAIEKQQLTTENRSLLAEAHRELDERAQIEAELRRYREHLEEMVRERTVELNTVIGQLRTEISQRKRVEEKLQEANDELKAFCYSVSHDLQSPLKAIGHFAETVREAHADQLDEKGRRFLNYIGVSARQMTELIDDLLNYSLMGRKKLNPSAINAEQLVADIIEELRAGQPERKIEVEILPLPALYADRAMMREVFSNLLSNAVKYAQSRKTVVIEVSGRRGDRESIFQVRDNGIGFDTKDAPRLFEVFQRLHSSDRFEGTGAGLAIVDRAIQRHGGRVWAEAEPDKGATFHFAIPDPPEAPPVRA
jgi:signal transduction histidine kinase